MRSIADKKYSDSDHFLIVGGTGRLGRLLRSAWEATGEDRMVWQARRLGAGIEHVYDPLGAPELYRRAATGNAVLLNLAGQVSTDPSDLSLHRDLALSALNAGHAAGVRHVFLTSSAAVYGAPTGIAHEACDPKPISEYGHAKLAMESSARDWADTVGADGPGVTCLRIGNVAGADQLLGRQMTEPRYLDIFADGHGPRRSYIGPMALASILSQLMTVAARGGPLPFILNVALDGCVPMESLLAAAGRAWLPRTAPSGAIAEVRLDVSQLASLVSLPNGGSDARAIVAELCSLTWPPSGDTRDAVKTSL